MSTPVWVGDREVCALAALVSQDRPDLPVGEGLPPSLIADLTNQIRCDAVVFGGRDSGRQDFWFTQNVPADDISGELAETLDKAFWLHFWDGKFCFFFNDTATTEIYPLSLHDALPSPT